MTPSQVTPFDRINLSLDISPHRQSCLAFYYLWSACWIMVLLDYFLAYRDVTGAFVFRRVFSMTREETVANWYASILLFLISLTCLGLYALSKRRGGALRPWLAFAGFFLFLSADDGARIHERLGGFFRDMATASENAAPNFFDQVLFFTGSYSWLVFVLPVFTAVALYMLYWGRKHVTEEATREFVMMGVVCLAFAVCLDYFEGLLTKDTISVKDWPIGKPAIEHFQRVIEEFLEMTAFLLVLRGLWVHALTKIQSESRAD